MKSRFSRILVSILIFSLALQTFTLPAQAQSEPNESQAGFVNVPPELALPYQRLSEDVERPDAIPPNPEIIAKTKAQVADFECTDDMDVPKIECEALVALYESTNGAGWSNNSNWLQSTTVSTWHGVTVPVGSGAVTHLSLNANRLNGNIPSDLGNLSNLRMLSLYANQLTGSIPSDLGNLSNLEDLYLGNNQLTGLIPSTLSNLSNLEGLYLNNNQLTGLIPSTLSNLSNLSELRLSSNQLTSIPVELGNLSNLSELHLNNNQLTSIPVELGNLSKLEVLDLSWNQLTGSIPSSLGNLSNLEDLYLGNNQLTGSIPSSLGKLSNLLELRLNYNQLTGIIPLSFVKLTKLLIFTAYSNFFCEPNTPEFITWKNTVETWSGTGVICKEICLPLIFR